MNKITTETGLDNYWDSLNSKQKQWVKDKCNWERSTRLAVVRVYKDKIDSLTGIN